MPLPMREAIVEVVMCVDCGRSTRPKGTPPAAARGDQPTFGSRGLCSPCHSRHSRAGTLDQFQRITRASADTIEDMLFLGFDPDLPRRPQFIEMAPKMGVKWQSLERAYLRFTRQNATT